jgi:hypothetical protein
LILFASKFGKSALQPLLMRTLPYAEKAGMANTAFRWALPFAHSVKKPPGGSARHQYVLHARPPVDRGIVSGSAADAAPGVATPVKMTKRTKAPRVLLSTSAVSAPVGGCQSVRRRGRSPRTPVHFGAMRRWGSGADRVGLVAATLSIRLARPKRAATRMRSWPESGSTRCRVCASTTSP